MPINEKPGTKKIDISVDRMSVDNQDRPKEYSISKLRSYLVKVVNHFIKQTENNDDS